MSPEVVRHVVRRTLRSNRTTAKAFLGCGVFMLIYIIVLAMHLNQLELAPSAASMGSGLPPPSVSKQRRNSNGGVHDGVGAGVGTGVKARVGNARGIDQIGGLINDLMRWNHAQLVKAKSHGASTTRMPPLKAYLEPPMKDTVEGTGNQKENVPPQYIGPLPLRETTPNDLRPVVFPHIKSCKDMPHNLPIDRGLVLDPATGERIEWNIFAQDEVLPLDLPSVCPVDTDPFLPWIHDVFPSSDGERIQFIAQNKRRCNSLDYSFVQKLEPQVALFQPVSVQRIPDSMANKLAPSLWQPFATDAATDETAESNQHTSTQVQQQYTQRYRLIPYDEADSDARYTRFICRFHMANYTFDSQSQTFAAEQSHVIAETLSTYDFNYEFIVWRKNHKRMFTQQGRDNGQYYLSTLRFACPVPAQLQPIASGGSNVLPAHELPMLFVDVVPIRTPPRHEGEFYFNEELVGPTYLQRYREDNHGGFDAGKRWGTNQVLPRVEASGRWANIPICRPPKVAPSPPPPPPSSAALSANLHANGIQSNPDRPALRNLNAINDSHQGNVVNHSIGKTARNKQKTKHIQKPHFLSACLWAASSFHDPTRVDGGAQITDSERRLREWLDFHLMVGVDHVYLYDNSMSNSATNQSFAKLIAQRYAPHQVTRIEWSPLECNNNPPTGEFYSHEGSSQYAAENSCRTRYAPFTEWMTHVDIDEYLVPMGQYTNLKDMLRDVAEASGTKILNFRNIGGKLRADMSNPTGLGRRQKANTTFLQAYNCDTYKPPKPERPGDRSKKQIFQAGYMRSHYVHYTLVTESLMQTYKDLRHKFQRRFPKDPFEGYVDELTQATLVHTKTLPVELSVGYESACHYKSFDPSEMCRIGYPWPDTTDESATISQDAAPRQGRPTRRKQKDHNADGKRYNCYVNSHIEKHWVPKLEQALRRNLRRGD